MSIRILASNDDGINSDGLRALAEAMRTLGEVVIVAPDRDQSAVSHSLSLYRPLRINKIAENCYSVDGTPTDCINLAVNGILRDKKPDLIVSGINKGENMGDDVTYSGTVSAAIEGTLLNIPSIAISLSAKRDFNFDAAAKVAQRLAEYVLATPLPEGTLLNANVPNLPTNGIRGIRVTRLGKRIYGEAAVERADPRGRKYYWIGGSEVASVEIENSDIQALRAGYVSVTPLKLDLTDYGALAKLTADLDIS
ncbi:MAG: 5'/3'-nucleotidase SurE [Deltaproteobacteria bacterium]